MKQVVLFLSLLWGLQVFGQSDLIFSFPLDGNATASNNEKLSGTMYAGVKPTTDRFGKPNGACEFDGTASAYIDIPYSTSIGTADFSVSYWSYAYVNSTNGHVFTKEQRGVGENQFRMGSTGTYFTCFGDVNAIGGGISYTPTISTWTYYTVVRKSGLVSLYVNGVYINKVTFAGSHNNSLNYRIGGEYSSADCYKGKIDDLRMYNRALTESEITANYTQDNSQQALLLANDGPIASSGVGQYVSVPAGNWFNSGEFTVDSWVYLRSYTPWARLFDFSNGVATENVLMALDNSVQKMDVSVYSGTKKSDNVLTSSIPLLTWTHLAFTLKKETASATTATARVYMNGNLILENAGVPIPAAVERTVNYIGKSPWPNDYYTNAFFDEFRIYNKVLTQAEIIERSHKHLTGNEDGLELYYDFNQFNGTTVKNLATKTGAKGDGTLVVSPAFAPSLALLTPFLRAASNVTKTGFTANWDTVQGAKSYEVEYAATADFSGSTKLQTTADSLNITPTTPITYVRVRASATSQTSEWATRTYFMEPGNALSLNGASAITLPYSPAYNTPKFTISYWAKPYVALPTQNQSPLASRDEVTQAYTGYNFWLNTNGQWSFHLQSKSGVGGTTWMNLYGSQAVANQWAHLVATYDGTTARLYVNGVKCSETLTTYAPNTVQPLYIGQVDGQVYPTYFFFNGAVDELSFWDKALDSASIIAMSHRTFNQQDKAGLTAYYDFNQLSGTTLFDQATKTDKITGGSAMTFTASQALLTPFVRTASNFEPTSFVANWDAVPNATSYLVQYASNNLFTNSKTEIANTNAFKIDSLLDGKTYYYKVQARTSTQTSDWTATASITTKLMPPGNALNMVASSGASLAPTLNILNQFTVEEWVNLKSNPTTDYTTFFSFGQFSTNSVFLLYRKATSKLEMWVSGGSQTWLLRGDSPSSAGYISTPFALNQWNHLAVTVKDDSVTVYLNGNIALNVKMTSKFIAGARTNNFIGVNEGSIRTGDISFDEFRLFNGVALSQVEIMAHAHKPLLGNEANLALYYNFDQTSGASVKNLVAGGTDLTFSTGTFTASQALLTPFVRTKTNITETSFMASWDSIPSARYEIERALDKAFSINKTSLSAIKNTAKITASVEGLKQYFRVRAITAIDTSDWAIDSVQCLGSVPATAIALNGIDQKVVIQSTKLYKSFMFWAYLDNSISGMDYLFDLRNSETPAYNGYFYNGGGSLTGVAKLFINGYPSAITSSDNLPRNQWVHLYIELPATANPALYLTLFNRVNLNEGMKGRVDELSIWNKTLTSTEILKYMHNSPTKNSDGLVAYYNFDNIVGNVISDPLGTGINAISNATIANLVQSKALLTPFIKQASAITETSYTAHCDKIAGATSYQLQNSLTADFAKGDTITTTDTVLLVKDLVKATSYNYRIRAITATDTSEWASATVSTLFTPPGNALSLITANAQYAQVPAGKWFKPNFTVEAWVKMRSTDNYSRLFDFGNGQNANNVLFAPSNNNSSVPLSILNGSAVTTIYSPKIPTNEWTHVAITVNKALATIYYNGRVVATQANVTIPAGGETSLNYIGKSNWNESYPNALYDEFKIYGKALTQAEIIARMHTPLKGDEDSLLLYYDFDQTVGNVVLNLAKSTGTTGNATTFNAPTFAPSQAILTPFVRKVDSSKVVSNKKLAFKWDSIPNATYEGQIATSADFSNITQSAPTDKDTISITLDGKQYAYFYRVRAINADGVKSDWTGGVYFDKTVAVPNMAYKGTNIVSIPDAAKIQFSGADPLTISSWIKFNTVVDSRLIQFNGAIANQSAKILYCNAGVLSFAYDDYFESGWATFTVQDFVLQPNAWYHIAVTQANGKVQIFINGKAAKLNTNTVPAIQKASVKATGGITLNGYGVSDLVFDNFQVWNTALPEADVIKYAHNGVSGSESGLVLAYNFNQFNGISVADLAASPLNATTTDNYASWTTSNAQQTPLVSFSKISDSTITIDWTKVPNAKNYIVKYSTDKLFTTATQLSRDTTSFDIPNAKSATKYYVVVKSKFDNDSSSWSPIAIGSTTSLTDSLIAYYPFNGNATNEATKIAATVGSSGVTPTTDRFGASAKAYSFNNGWIDAGNTNNLDGSFTIAAWIKPNTLGQTGILSKHQWTGANPNHVSGYFLSISQIKSGDINMVAGTGLDHKYSTTPENLVKANQWQLICTKYSASDSLLQVYVNDVLVDTFKQVPPSIKNTIPFQIGVWNGGGYFNGAIDDIRIFHRTLSDNELSRLYHEGGWPYVGVKLDVANNQFTDQQDINTTVGNILPVLDTAVHLTVTPSDFTYTFVGGDGSADNAKFTLNGTVLKSNYIFDALKQTTASIRVRGVGKQGTPNQGITFDRALTINIVPNAISDVYDFDTLKVGNITKQGGWKTYSWNDKDSVRTSVDAQGIKNTNALYYNQTGSFVGGDASNKLTNLFKNVKFDDLSAQYVISYDVSSSSYGTFVGLGVDTANTGVFFTDYTKQAFSFKTSARVDAPGLFFMPDRTQQALLQTTFSGWYRIEFTLSNLDKANAKISARARSLASESTSWLPILNETSFAVDTTKKDNANPRLWNTFFVHVENATGIIDNLSFSKRIFNKNRATLSDGLIAHYKMDGNMLDASGNNLNGVASTGTPVLTTDRFNTPNAAYNFNARSNFKADSIGTKLNLNDVTVSVWANITGAAYCTLFDIINNENRFEIHPKWADAYNIYFDYGNIGGVGRLCTPSPITANVWEHYVVVSSKAKDSMFIYLNNKLVIAKKACGVFPATTAPLYIGGSAYALPGSLDDMRIYNRPLSKEEIASLYYEGGWPVQQISVPASVNLAVGASQQLQVSVKPIDAPTTGLVYASGNTAIATIDNTGKITAVAKGTAEITVATVSGAVSASTIVTVGSQLPDIKTINIRDTAITLLLNGIKNHQLKSSYAPSNASTADIHWRSTDELVASVNNGFVTALQPGSAWVYVYADIAEKVKDSCKFVVLPSAIPTLSVGNQTQYNLQASSVNNGVITKNILQIGVASFFHDDDSVLTYTVSPLSTPKDTMQVELVNGEIRIYQRDSLVPKDTIKLSVTATDLDGQSVVEHLSIAVSTAPNKAPVVSPAPTASAMYQFRRKAVVDLKNFIVDDYTPFGKLTYDSLRFAKNIATTIAATAISNNKISASISAGKLKIEINSTANDQLIQDTIRFRVFDGKNATLVSVPFEYKVVPNAKPVFTTIKPIIIDTVGDMDPLVIIDLAIYASDDHTKTNELTWGYVAAKNLNVSLTGSILELSASSSAWAGTELITVWANDGTFKGETTISYTQLVRPLSGRPNVDFKLSIYNPSTKSYDALPSMIARNETVYADTLLKDRTIVTDSVTWIFDGAVNSTVRKQVQKVKSQYNKVGVYNVKLLASNGSGTTVVSKTKVINVAGIVSNKTSLCVGDTLKLAASDSTLDGYQWLTQSDGKEFSTKANVLVTPKEATTYILTMNGNGIKVVDTITINVIKPATSIANDTVLCAGTTVEIKPRNVFNRILWNGVSASTYAATKADSIFVQAWVDAAGVCPVLKDTIVVTELPAPKITNLPAVLNLCSGVSDTLIAKGGTSYAWNDGTTKTARFIVTKEGTYTVTVTGSEACSASFTTQVFTAQKPTVTASVDNDTVCAGVQVKLSNAGAVSYKWNDGKDTSIKRVITSDTTFTVTGTDANKCSNTANVKVVALKPYKEQLGVVTYDSTNGKKVIIAWNRHKGKRSERYAVLRQKDAVTWDTIGRRAFNDSALIIDATAKLDVQTFSYKLVTIDSVCHNKTESDFHRTMHVTNSISNDGKITVEWNSYIGLALLKYEIYRVGTEYTYLGEVPNNATDLKFTDEHPVKGTSYRVLFKLPETVSPALTKSDSGPFSQSLSNMSEASLVSNDLVSSFKIEVYPQPANNVMNITLDDNNGATINLYAANGSIVAQTTIANNAATFDVSRLASGLYLLEMQTKEGTITKSVSISK